MKLVPFYMAGETLFTAVGVQNMSDQEQDTINKNTLVSDIKDFLAGKAATSVAATAIGEEGATVDATATPPTVAGESMLGENDLNTKAQAEAALAAADEDAHVEHLIATVMVYDMDGMMMAEAELCLAENQFGYVLLTGPDMPEQEIDNRGVVVSMEMDDIDDYGYMTVRAGTKYEDCSGSRQNRIGQG